MSDLTVFEFESHAVRFVGTADDPWWVAADVCTALEVKNPSQAIERLDDDERAMFNIGRQGEAWCINESGLYSLVLTSRKAQAKRFKKWITSEVLPNIRKIGKYQLPQVEQSTVPHPETKLLPPSVEDICNVIDLTLGKTDLHPNLIAGKKLNAIAKEHPNLAATAEEAKSALSLPVEDELLYPTDLGKKLELSTSEKWSGIRVNKALTEQGFQIPNPEKNPSYLPTEKGKPYSKLTLDTARGRDKTVQTLKWYPSVLDVLEVQ